MAGQGWQQGGAVIQPLKNAADTRCGIRAGLHTDAFLFWGAEAAGLPLIPAGWSCRILSQLLLWLSLSCCWLRMPQDPWCGTAGTPTHSLSRVLPQARLCAHSSALFSFSIHLREALFCPSLLHVPRQIFFLRAHQCLETQRDTQEAPSTPGTTPSFPGTQTPFPIP